MSIGRPALHYGFKREPGRFCARVVKPVGIERLRVGQGQIIFCRTASGKRGEDGEAEENDGCVEL